MARRIISTRAASAPPPDSPEAWLWPSEFLAVVSCPDVPLEWRRVYALATYLYLRGGELGALEWSDIDLEHGVAHSHRAMARDQRKTKSTKTGVVRRYRIEPALLPLLKAMHAESGGVGRIVTLGDRKHWAANLRTHLRMAQVERAELYADDATASTSRSTT